MRLRFVIGNVADFETLGIDISTCRKSIDGTKTLIHQEFISDEQFEACIEADKFEFKSGANLETMLQSDEWNTIQ